MNYSEAAEIVMGKLAQVVKVDFTEYHDRSAAFAKEVAKEVGIGIYKYQVVRPDIKRTNRGNFTERHPELVLTFGDKKTPAFTVDIQKMKATKKAPECWAILCPSWYEESKTKYGLVFHHHVFVDEVTVENTVAFVRECMIQKMTPVEIANHRLANAE